jgi:hypothetical protein
MQRNQMETLFPQECEPCREEQANVGLVAAAHI